MELTESEKLIIENLRSLRPMEVVVIRADGQGKVDKFYVKRTEAFFVAVGFKHPTVDKLLIKDS